MESSIRYRWTDAWLLAAIANASQKRPVELWEIIAEGDNLNHAIFTDEEVESGLVRLTEGGWIKEENGRFIISEKFKKIGLKTITISFREKVEKLLNAEPWNPNEPVPHPLNKLKYIGLSKEALKGAKDKYQKKNQAYL